MASALTDTVKQRTEEIKTSLKETDWRAELGGLQKDLKEESEEVAQHAREASEQLGHKARSAVEALPGAVQNLPTSISVGNLPEAGAKLTREASAKVGKTGKQLGAMSQRFVNKTTDLFDTVVNSIQEANDAHRLNSSRSKSISSLKGGNTKSQRYSRLESDITAMQRDSSTYCDQPEDTEQFEQWLQDFDLKTMKKEIGSIIGSNAFMAELQSRIVPLIVSYDDFWTRYFYRLHKLHAKHEAIQALTSKASEAGGPLGDGREEEEELGWGTDEEEGEEGEEGEKGVVVKEEEEEKDDEEASREEEKVTTAAFDEPIEHQTQVDGVDDESVEEPSRVEPKEEEVEEEEDVEEETEEASTADDGEVIVEKTEKTDDLKKKKEEEKDDEEEEQPEEAVEKVSSDLSSDFELDDEPLPTGGDGVVTGGGGGEDEDEDWNSDWE